MKTGWKLQHMAHAVSENQHGLVVATSVSACSPRAERQAAIAMVRRLKKTALPRTVVADKGYHKQDFVEELRQMNVAAHVPPYPVGIRRCWVDPALYDRPEYAASQKKRKWIERFFSWLKTTAQRARHDTRTPKPELELHSRRRSLQPHPYGNPDRLSPLQFSSTTPLHLQNSSPQP
jgi:hypothetical protein